jgi:hypothetical protein
MLQVALVKLKGLALGRLPVSAQHRAWMTYFFGIVGLASDPLWPVAVRVTLGRSIICAAVAIRVFRVLAGRRLPGSLLLTYSKDSPIFT